MNRGRLILVLAALVILAYSPAEAGRNLIPNPGFLSPDGKNPFFWHHGVSDIGRVSRSSFSVGVTGNPPLPAISITGGTDREGYWYCLIDGIEPGKDYLLSFRVFRDSFVNGYYPSFEIFGIRTRLNNHVKYGAWQDFAFLFNSGKSTSTVLSFHNDYPVMFSFSSPVLREIAEEEVSVRAVRKPREGTADRERLYKAFPLGVYGADTGEFEDVRKMGFNTVVTGIRGKSTDELFSALLRNDLNAILVPPDSREALATALEEIRSSDELRDHILGFYIADEPEIRSLPLKALRKKIERIESHLPGLPSFMAIVRPRYVSAYSDASDIILMDQYPIPAEPLTWLSESIDTARNLAPPDRDIWAVIQAFGGGKWKGSGWGRLPRYREMRVLSYLAVVHGARGLLYYTYRSMRDNEAHRESIRRLIGELKVFGEAFLSDFSTRLRYEPGDLYRTGFDGAPPVHARIFRTGERQYYLVAVNTINKTVRGEVTGIPRGIRYLDEFFYDRRYVVKEGAIRDVFNPYEVKIYVSGRKFPKVTIKRGSEKIAVFHPEKASDNRTGLMFRKSLNRDGGMIFEFPSPVRQPFWMLNMGFPVDLLFFDSRNRLTDFYQNVMPCTEADSCPEYYPSTASRYVLELRAGTIEAHGMRKGDRLYIEQGIY
jgi:hypothetical protein